MSTATPQERVRASIALTVTPEMAERLLQFDKANPSFKLSDLQDDDERAIWIADILDLLSPERRAERAIRLNTLRGYVNAMAEDEQQTLDREARRDIIRFGNCGKSDTARFGVISSDHCYICRERVITNRVTLVITENLHTIAHGLCCAKDDDRFELLDESAQVYRVKAGRS